MKHAKKHRERLSEIGSRKDQFDETFFTSKLKQYDRVGEMSYLNDLEFWKEIFVAVKGSSFF